VQAIQSVQIVPRVTAFIDQEPTPQGSNVKAGQVLFVLQKRQYEAAVQSAQAQLGLRQRLMVRVNKTRAALLGVTPCRDL
jgi:membrane fusion protein (multidrug efflux system)